MSKIFLSVVIPCYNEQQNLERGVLDEVTDYLSQQDYTYEIIISDDASSDKSRTLTKDFVKKHKHIRLLENPHGGKAWALRYGLFESRGEYTLFTDMDQSTPITELDKLLPAVKEGSDVVIGSRGFTRKNFSPFRKLASASFGAFRRSILLPHIDDTQCGFKLVQTHMAKDIFNKMLIFKADAEAKGWTVAAWDVEFLFLAEKYGHPITETLVEWQDEDTSTGKNRSLFKFTHESIDMLKQILRVRLNDIRGYYA